MKYTIVCALIASVATLQVNEFKAQNQKTLIWTQPRMLPTIQTTTPETTPTPSSQTNIPHGTASLIPTTTTLPELTVVPTGSQLTIIQFMTMESRSNSKPSMLTQRPSTELTDTPPSQSHAPPAGNERCD